MIIYSCDYRTHCYLNHLKQCLPGVVEGLVVVVVVVVVVVGGGLVATNVHIMHRIYSATILVHLFVSNDN